MQKLVCLLLILLSSGFALSRPKQTKNKTHKRHKDVVSKAMQEQMELFSKVQKNVRRHAKEVKQKIAIDYQLINQVEEKFKKIKLMHGLALELEETIKEIKNEYKGEANKEKQEGLEEALKSAQIAVRELDKAQKIISKSVAAIDKEFDKLFGLADKVFEKAHIMNAQTNIDLATSELAKSFDVTKK